METYHATMTVVRKIICSFWDQGIIVVPWAALSTLELEHGLPFWACHMNSINGLTLISSLKTIWNFLPNYIDFSSRVLTIDVPIYTINIYQRLPTSSNFPVSWILYPKKKKKNTANEKKRQKNTRSWKFPSFSVRISPFFCRRSTAGAKDSSARPRGARRRQKFR